MGRGLVIRDREQVKASGIRVRLTSAERAALDQAARASGVTASEVIRGALATILRIQTKADPVGASKTAVAGR